MLAKKLSKRYIKIKCQLLDEWKQLRRDVLKIRDSTVGTKFMLGWGGEGGGGCQLFSFSFSTLL